MFGETQPIPSDEMDNSHPARTIPGDRPDDFLPQDNLPKMKSTR